MLNLSGDIVGIQWMIIEHDWITVTPISKTLDFTWWVDVTDMWWYVTEIHIRETFRELTDTPNSYTWQAGKKVVVNQAEDWLEFVDDVSTFLELLDTPNSYTWQWSKMVTVKPTEDWLEFTTATPVVVWNLPWNVEFELDTFNNVHTWICQLSTNPANQTCVYVYTDSGTLLKEWVDYSFWGNIITPLYDLWGITIYAKYYSEWDIIKSVKEGFTNVTTSITLQYTPMDDDNLKIFTDSGTRLFKTIDWTITNNIVTFVNNLWGVNIWTGYDVAQQQVDMIHEIHTSVTTGITLANTPSSIKWIDLYNDSWVMLFEWIDWTISWQNITFTNNQWWSDIIVIYPTN